MQLLSETAVEANAERLLKQPNNYKWPLKLMRLLSLMCLSMLICQSVASAKTGNIRIGDLELDLKGSLTQDYDSNIGRANSDSQSDFITKLGVSLGGDLELTSINTLSLSLGAEYRKYWNNPEYDSDKNSIILTPDTRLELVLMAGNFEFRIYEEFSLLSDPGDQRFIDPSTNAVIADIVLYNRIRNRVGVDGIWTINPYLDANTSLSRLDIIPLGSDFEDTQRHSYTASLGLTHYYAANLDLLSRISGSIDRWETNFQPGSSSLSPGVGANWQPSEFIETEIFLAWTTRSFDSNGNNGDGTEESKGFTGNFFISHAINSFITHSFTYNRSLDLGNSSNGVNSQLIDYRIDYTGFERSSLFLSINWNQGIETDSINSEEYERWVFRTGLGYPLSSQLDFYISFDRSIRDSNLVERNYSRNLCSVKLTYDF